MISRALEKPLEIADYVFSLIRNNLPHDQNQRHNNSKYLPVNAKSMGLHDAICLILRIVLITGRVQDTTVCWRLIVVVLGRLDLNLQAPQPIGSQNRWVKTLPTQQEARKNCPNTSPRSPNHLFLHLTFCCSQIGVPILGIYITLTDT